MTCRFSGTKHRYTAWERFGDYDPETAIAPPWWRRRCACGFEEWLRRSSKPKEGLYKYSGDRVWS